MNCFKILILKSKKSWFQQRKHLSCWVLKICMFFDVGVYLLFLRLLLYSCICMSGQIWIYFISIAGLKESIHVYFLSVIHKKYNQKYHWFWKLLLLNWLKIVFLNGTHRRSPKKKFFSFFHWMYNILFFKSFFVH